MDDQRDPTEESTDEPTAGAPPRRPAYDHMAQDLTNAVKSSLGVPAIAVAIQPVAAAAWAAAIGDEGAGPALAAAAQRGRWALRDRCDVARERQLMTSVVRHLEAYGVI